VVRVLETAALRTVSADSGPGERPCCAFEGPTDIYINPGFRFRVVDAMVTNFHLPRSTLLVLVAAFAGLQQVKDAYRIAIDHRYRFYSFGDAMLIL
jgi:S-adenosylmethionine:tRNA ribosyltransferase-isomerase